MPCPERSVSTEETGADDGRPAPTERHAALVDALERPWDEVAAVSDGGRRAIDLAPPVALVLVTYREGQDGRGFGERVARWAQRFTVPVEGPVHPRVHSEEPDFAVAVALQATNDAVERLRQELDRACRGERLVACFGVAATLAGVHSTYERLRGASLVVRRAAERLGLVMHLNDLLPYHAAVSLNLAEQDELLRATFGGFMATRGADDVDVHLDTLWAQVRNMKCNVPAAAADLHLHPNTLRYRRGVLEDATGVDVDRDSLGPLLALCLRDLRGDRFHPPGDPWWAGE